MRITKMNQVSYSVCEIHQADGDDDDDAKLEFPGAKREGRVIKLDTLLSIFIYSIAVM